MNKAWLDNLAAGDQVIISGGYGPGRVATVERLTKTQFVLEGRNARYRRRDGFAVGEHYYRRSYLDKPTPERVDAIVAQRLRDEIRGTFERTEAKRIPLANLREIHRLMTEGLQDEDATH